MKPLFDLSDGLLALEADLEREDLTDEQREALIDAWLEAQGDVTAKLDNYAAFIEAADAMAEMRQEQAERMQRLAQADKNRAKAVKLRLKAYFERHDLIKFKTARFTISVQKNGGVAPLIVPELWRTDPHWAPERFHKVTVTLDNEAIRAAVGVAAVGSIRELCPVCGDDAVFDEQAEEATCSNISCAWAGGADRTVRLGERGTSIRIR